MFLHKRGEGCRFGVSAVDCNNTHTNKERFIYSNGAVDTVLFCSDIY
jgi:hypothetical protein